MRNEIDNDFQVSNCQLQKCDWPGKRQSEIYNDFYLMINKKSNVIFTVYASIEFVLLIIILLLLLLLFNNT